ncbi:Fusaric acid resistance protein-like-domain-containing protein [Phlyctochytrium arcticum]|nr:Fusaric acid resistance protein-like-domain-containing protein [Phlyctochytrium arcticum]
MPRPGADEDVTTPLLQREPHNSLTVPNGQPVSSSTARWHSPRQRCWQRSGICNGLRKGLLFMLAIAQQMCTTSTAKAVLVYMVAMLPTYLEYTQGYLGGSSYLLVTATLYFHPARTVGAMFEAMICCIAGLTAGYLIASGCLQLALFYQEEQRNDIEAHSIALVTLALETFVLAFVRAKFGVARPAIGTACTITHILTFITITQMSSDAALLHLSNKLVRTASSLFCGTCISFLGCCCLWPKTAANVLRQELSKSLANLRKFFEVLSDTLSIATEAKTVRVQVEEEGGMWRSASDPQVDLDSIMSQQGKLERMVHQHQRTLLRLRTLQYEVTFEPTTSMFLHRQHYSAIFQSAERLSQHLGGIQSSIVEVDTIITQESDNQALVEFMRNMGGSLNQLINTCRESISLMEAVFTAPAQEGEDADSILPALDNIALRLSTALDEFDANQRKVLMEIYQHVHEDVFLVFFFVFELLEIGKELIRLVQALEALKIDILERRQVGKLSWLWRVFKNRKLKNRRAWRQGKVHLNGPSAMPGKSGYQPSPGRIPRVMSMPGTIVRENTESWGKRLWDVFTSLKQFEVRFAIKTAVTITLMAIPAFLEQTQDIYYDFRMHWALTTFVAIMTPSIGGTNTANLWRILGTIGGAFTALLVGTLAKEDAIATYVASTLVSIPCMYVYTQSKYPKVGQIYLMTYSIIILNDYAGTVDPVTGRDYSLPEIAFRRGFAVMVGCLVGLLVSWVVWPLTARKALRMGLSNTLFDMGLLYSRLVGLFDRVDDPTNEDLQDFLEEELDLRLALAELQGLLAQTTHEPRLRGKFPKAIYARMLEASTQILDKFVSLRVGVTKEGFSKVRADFIHPVQPARRKLIRNILLYFYLLAGALILRYPLPPEFPDAREAHDQLIEAIRALPAVRPRNVGSHDDPAYIYYYAYVMGMDDVVKELEIIGKCCTDLFGVMALGDTSAVDSLFYLPQVTGVNLSTQQLSELAAASLSLR